MDGPEPQHSGVSRNLNRDYISNLPADLKEKILVKLPIKEAVRTSILSSNWKDSWTRIPSLVFEENSSNWLVENVLIFHDGPILKFKLVSEHPCNETISRWMVILSRNGIRDLDLSFNGNEGCKISSRLFSCLVLECVALSGCIINVPQFFQGFKLLRTLSLSYFDLSGITIENLVSGCPLLERLVLCSFVKQGCLHILAPNLRDLDIWGEFQDLCLETPKLVSGCIHLIPCNGDHKKIRVKAGIESNIKRAFGYLHNIQELHIGSAFIDYLAMGPIPENPPTIFNRLTVITVPIYCSNRDQIAAALCLFKSAPNIKVLNIEFLDYDGRDQLQGQTFWKLKATEDCLFKFLETLNIIYEQMHDFDESSRRDESMLEFAELVLSAAPMLAKLSIIDFEDPTVYRTKLECFPKLSEKAEFVFVKRLEDAAAFEQ